MQLKSALVAALLGVSSMVEASTIPARAMVPREPASNFGNNFKGGNGGNTNNAAKGSANNNNNANANTGKNNNGGATLNPNVIQTGSDQTGQAGNAVEAGQVNSLTDPNDFINFCAGKTLTNGTQNVKGSCNPIPMGEIPAKTKMVSSMLTFPAHNDNIAANKEFNVSLKIQNIQTGFFTNAQTTYFSAPQQVNQQGQVIGHTHVTIQDMGKSLNAAAPLDPTQFVFFKGINNAADASGTLTATVPSGLPAGNYRVCTMAGASNHQPVIMPVAQRGAQDDCNKFTVTANGGGNANAGKGGGKANAGKGGANAGNANANTGKTGKNSGSNSNNNGGNSNANQSNGNPTSSAATAAATGATGSTGQSGSGASGAIGGIAAPAVTNSGDSTRPFSVNGNTFVNKAAAVQRACSIQNNACADAVNSGSVKGFTVADCNKQETTCNAQS